MNITDRNSIFSPVVNSYTRAIEAFQKYLTNSCASSVTPLRIESLKIFRRSSRCSYNFLCIDQSECSRIRCSTLIGQLSECCESFKNRFKILRIAARLPRFEVHI